MIPNEHKAETIIAITNRVEIIRVVISSLNPKSKRLWKKPFHPLIPPVLNLLLIKLYLLIN